MRSLGIIILVLVIKLAAVSAAMTGQDPKDLIKAATSRPRTRAPQPDSPALSSEMRERIVSEITESKAIRRAYEKLDANRRNTEWYDGLAELEKQKALWSLLSCLRHPHDSVQLHALRSLKRLQDKRAVPFLLSYAECRAVYVSGSENATVHGIIQETIAETLSSLTGISITIRGQDPEGLMSGIGQWRRSLANQNIK
jgi:hypothetical protein